jgi:thiamine pyrophosphokinase
LKRAIILANGKPPKKSNITYYRKKGFSTLICADGGSNSARKLKMIPDFIIGDLDSITEENLKFFEGKSQIIHLKRQNDTDVEKCLKFAIKNNIEQVILMGATGDRLDHTFCNLGIVIKFFERISINIVAEKSLLVPYTGFIELNTEPGETISLYGFNNQTTIESKGLKYPLNGIALPFGERESTSNIATGKSIELDIKGGIVFIIRHIEVIKRNNF